MNIQEKDIVVPWGSLSLKLWGDPKNPAIVCLHGALDNIGTFNRLVPVLPHRYFYIGVDFPGHGKSDGMAANIPIHCIDYLFVLKLVIDHFEKERYILLGHSIGGQLSIAFAQIYPKSVERVILLDGFNIIPAVYSKFRRGFEENINYYFDIVKSTDFLKKYTYKEALQMVARKRYAPISEKDAEELLERMLIPVGNDEYTLSTDFRFKANMNPIRDFTHIIETLKHNPILCPVLVIMADTEVQLELMKPILLYYKTLKNFILVKVNGPHDVHFTEPNVVAHHIISFLSNSKL